MSGEMKREILIEDGLGGLHKVKYLDENRVTVQTVTRYLSDPEASGLSMPAKVKLDDIHTWPFTKGLQDKILSWHAQFPNAE